MELSIKTASSNNLFGRTDEPSAGKKMFVVTWVDSEDSEDTRTELWIANDEDDLYDLVKNQYEEDRDDGAEPGDGENDSEDEQWVDEIYEKKIEDSWGIEILSFEIGTIL
jgi:hypothetical protein